MFTLMNADTAGLSPFCGMPAAKIPNDNTRLDFVLQIERQEKPAVVNRYVNDIWGNGAEETCALQELKLAQRSKSNAGDYGPEYN